MAPSAALACWQSSETRLQGFHSELMLLQIIREVKSSYTLGLLLKDHSVKFLSTSQSVREVDGPGYDVSFLSMHQENA